MGSGDAEQTAAGGTFDGSRASAGSGDHDRRQGQPAFGADATGDGGDDSRPTAAVLVVRIEVVLGELVTQEFCLAGVLVDPFLRLAPLSIQLGLSRIPDVESAGAQALQPAAGVVGLFRLETGASLGLRQRRQLLTLRVQIALQLLERAVVGDRAGIEPLIGDLDPALGGLDDGVRLAHGLIGATGLFLLGFDLGIELGNERWIGDLVENGLEFAIGPISLDVNFLKLLHPFKVHEGGSFSFVAAGTGPGELGRPVQ